MFLTNVTLISLFTTYILELPQPILSTGNQDNAHNKKDESYKKASKSSNDEDPTNEGWEEN